MSYSQNTPFENREHIVWEIGYCGKAGEYFIILGLIFAVLGIIGDLLNMKLGLGSTSWLLLAVVFVVGSLAPHMHMIMAKHLLGMEIIKKDQA
jgi:uncharacterized membrane protein YbaN (DUF454 family)